MGSMSPEDSANQLNYINETRAKFLSKAQAASKATYTTVAQQAQQSQSVPSELVGVKGAISVPAASGYSDSKTSLNEIAAFDGDLASVAEKQNIEICGFLSDLPSIDIDLSAPQLGIPELQDLVKDINGLAFPPLEFASEAIVGVIGGASKAVGDLASAIQNAIPTITCGGKPPAVPVPTPEGLAAAITPSVPVSAVGPALEKIGTTPEISVSSPDVTVQSLNDVIEAGEF